MYKIKEEYIKYFKEIRTSVYATQSGCTAAFYSSVLNGNKRCTEAIAKIIISIREDMTLKDVHIGGLLNKYFTREEE